MLLFFIAVDFIAVRAVVFPMETLDENTTSSLRVTDSGGALLRRETHAGQAEGTWVRLKQISPFLVQATLAAEDRRFFSHGGVDIFSLFRSAWLNLKSRKVSFGGSTITMQLVRLTARIERSLGGKLKQMYLARNLELHLSKEQILEQYLNRAYYGNGAWGAESAARFYFSKHARDLSLGESVLLAVIPRGPNRYNPFLHRERVDERFRHILKLMVKNGAVDEEKRGAAQRIPLILSRNRQGFLAPHFVDIVKERLLEGFDKGTVVRTTLNLRLQERMEQIIAAHVDGLSWRNLTQAAMVVLRNRDGAVLAMVGSRNYFDRKNNGAFNGATATLRPGSTLKPFVYGAAFEKGDTPSTIAYDVILPTETHEFYTKDVRSHGFARYRESLAGSYNLSAVHVLQRIGISTLLAKLRDAGLSTLTKPDNAYDWGLAIGHADVRLLDLASAFSNFGRGGRPIVPRFIEEAVRADGAVFGEKPREGKRVFSEEIAYLIFDILSDADARRPMFGDSVPLNLPFSIALKTGTTKAYTDLWAVGVTREYTIGVWAGNFDGEPTHRVHSVQGATPLIASAYEALAAQLGRPTAPKRPSGIVTRAVCPVSGKLPGSYCPHRKMELFLKGKEPSETCDWHQKACGEVTVVYPKPLESWAAARGLGEITHCNETSSEGGDPKILSPTDGAVFVIDPYRPKSAQRPILKASPFDAALTWTIDGYPASDWIPKPGEHRVEVTNGSEVDAVTILYKE